ncbi:MAG TPA: response regulator [Melioribacteraceae bacterium]|nr:response regulator [Melioribacteraceae bacterium]
MNSEKNILIVEDDSMLQEFYKVLFKRLGYKCSISENGDEIIDNIVNRKVDLLIVDLNLKNTFLNSKAIDGVSLARYIKQNFYTLRIPILVITAYSASYFADDLLKEGFADDYMLKPIVNFDLLIQKVDNLLCQN